MIASISNGLDRIRSATQTSPIAVFKRARGFNGVRQKSPITEPALDFTFAKTVFSSAAIHRGDPSLVGIFDKSMNMDWVEQRLRKVAKELHAKSK